MFVESAPEISGATTVSVARRGNAIATGGADGRVRIWRYDGAPRLETELLGAARAGIRAVAFMGSGDRLAVGDGSGRLRIVDRRSGRDVDAVHAHVGSVNAVGADASGRVVTTAGDDGSVVLWALQGRRIRYEADRRIPTVASATVPTHDGRWVVSGGYDNEVTRWSPDTPEAADMMFRGHLGEVEAIDVSQRRVIASGGADGIIRLWPGRPSAWFAGELPSDDARASAVAFGAGGRLIGAVVAGRLRLFDGRSGRALPTPRQFLGSAPRLEFSPAGDRLVAASSEGAALFEVAGTALRRRWETTGTVADVAFFARGRRVAVGYESGEVEIRDARHSTVIDRFKAVEPALYTVDVDDAGRRLAAVTASASGPDRIWDLRANRPVVAFDAFPDAVLSRDGDALFVVDRFVGDRSVIEVRDAHTGTVRTSAPHGLRNVEAVALHPDENALALGDESGRIRVIDPRTGEIKGREWRAGFGAVSDVDFSPSGDRLAAVTAGHAEVWSLSELDPAALVAEGCRRVGRNLQSFEWKDAVGFEADPPAICPGVAPNWFDAVADGS